jgi:hypothetical protein
MTSLFFIIVSVAIVVFQTSFFPHIPILRGFYDLLLPMVICIALYRPMRYNFIFILLIAYLADSLSGGPLGLYLTSYFWVFITIAWVTNYLQIQGGILLLFVVPVSVFFQNIVSFTVLALMLPGAALPVNAMQIMSVEVFWAILTGPLVLAMFRRGSGLWNNWAETLFVDRRSELG